MVLVSDLRIASSTTRRAFWTTSSPLSGRLDGLLLRFGIPQAWHGSSQAVKREGFQIDPLPEIQTLAWKMPTEVTIELTERIASVQDVQARNLDLDSIDRLISNHKLEHLNQSIAFMV